MTLQAKRFLVVGEGIWHWYMEAASQALREIGYEVHEFRWADTFKVRHGDEIEPSHRSTWHRLEERIGVGPVVQRLNERLLRDAAEVRPHFVFFYNVRLVTPRTVRKLRRMLPSAIFGQYANDNPFSERASPGFWRNFKRSVPLFDLHFAYRHSNLQDYRDRGATDVHLLRSYFLPELDRPISPQEISERDRSDVLFAGHYEPDGRLETLAAIADSGVRLRLHGGGWTPILEKLPRGAALRLQHPAAPIVDRDYRLAIAGTTVALCFLSTMNKDTYTRRNFEIPAIGTAVLSQYSEDLAQLFEEGEEIEFFRSPEEAVVKVKSLLDDPAQVMRLAHNGRQRVLRDGHDVLCRMTSLSEAYESSLARRS